MKKLSVILSTTWDYIKKFIRSIPCLTGFHKITETEYEVEQPPGCYSPAFRCTKCGQYAFYYLDLDDHGITYLAYVPESLLIQRCDDAKSQVNNQTNQPGD